MSGRALRFGSWRRPHATHRRWSWGLRFGWDRCPRCGKKLDGFSISDYSDSRIQSERVFCFDCWRADKARKEI